MKKMFILLLALAVLCASLAGCRPDGEGKNGNSTAPTVEYGEGPELPEITMPTKPDADYQLPPGERPGSGNVQTK